MGCCHSDGKRGCTAAKILRGMSNSVASALNVIARDAGFSDSEALSRFIADYFADDNSDHEYDSGKTLPKLTITMINNQLR